MKHKILKYIVMLISLFLLPAMTFAQNGYEPALNGGDAAWIIVATILVMMMTIPGLALFYGGLVRRKNVLSVLMQCLILTAVIIIEQRKMWQLYVNSWDWMGHYLYSMANI